MVCAPNYQYLVSSLLLVSPSALVAYLFVLRSAFAKSRWGLLCQVSKLIDLDLLVIVYMRPLNVKPFPPNPMPVNVKLFPPNPMSVNVQPFPPNPMSVNVKAYPPNPMSVNVKAYPPNPMSVNVKAYPLNPMSVNVKAYPPMVLTLEEFAWLTDVSGD